MRLFIVRTQHMPAFTTSMPFRATIQGEENLKLGESENDDSKSLLPLLTLLWLISHMAVTVTQMESASMGMHKDVEAAHAKPSISGQQMTKMFSHHFILPKSEII